jgi:hypothetical protein
MKVWKRFVDKFLFILHLRVESNFCSSFTYEWNPLKGLAYNGVLILGVQSIVLPYLMFKN